MHRGSHHYGSSFDSSYSRRGYHNDDGMLDVVQQFREFKPYLKKRLANIIQTGREIELQDEIEDIKFYLEVMEDVLADESHGVDQLRSFIDKIHEMIRKNPSTDFQTTKRRSLDNVDEFDDNDRPRSPSPGARGSDSGANDIPVIPTHGAHRTVEVNFSSHKDHSKPNKRKDADEWGTQTFENSFTRREHYKDVDMRESFFGGAGPSGGRGNRRWSEESDQSGARSFGRGLSTGHGSSMPRHGDGFRRDRDTNRGRGRGYSDSYDSHNNDWYHVDRNRGRGSHYDVKHEKEPEFKAPDWLTGASGPSNGKGSMDDWQNRSDSRDSGFRSDFERRSRESDEWRSDDSWGRSEPRDERQQHSHPKPFERPEPRRDDAPDFHSLYERRPRNERPHDPSPVRTELNAPPPEFSHSHGEFHGRGRGRVEDDRHRRNRMEAGPVYSPHGATTPLINPMNSISMTPTPVSIGYGAPQPPMHYSNTTMIPPSPYGTMPPLLPLPVPNASNPRMNLPIPNIQQPMAAGVQHLGFHQPPVNNFGRPEIHASPTGYANVPPPQTRPPPPHHPSENYRDRGASPSYASPVETSPDIREISMLKAKQCFGRIRPSTSSTSQQLPSATTPTSPGPTSPTTGDGNSSQTPNHSALDPRLNRMNRPGIFQAGQNRQQSPPAVPTTSGAKRSDAGNVLRPSADPRSRNRQDDERRKLQEKRERVRQQEAIRVSNNKVSKIQELRKQFEKEGLHRLGRPAPNSKKQNASFEEAIGTFDNEQDISNKSTDKNKSQTGSQSKDKEGDAGRQGRSQSDKTDREKSPKKGGEKNKQKTSSKNNDKKDSEASLSSEKQSRKKANSNNKGEKATASSATGSRSEGGKSASKATPSDKSETQIPDSAKLAGFKIPRKPKPKQPEPEVQVESDKLPSDKGESTVEVSLSPPASPEPALSQVPDVENRVDDGEAPSSSKSKAPESSKSTEVSPDVLECLKQFLLQSAEPAEKEFILESPDNLKDFFFRIKKELKNVKGKRSDDANPVTDNDNADSEKAAPDPEEEVLERGRSREKKKNAKRRSSLEKLHDALKEMRFDTMLPLGPRRCTRGVQEETTTETNESSETTPSKLLDEEDSNPSADVEQIDGPTKKIGTRKRGRPLKESPNAKKNTTTTKDQIDKCIDDVIGVDKEDDEEVIVEDPIPLAKPSNPRRGRKRKLKPAKLKPRKRTKKSGPVTRAQAALKKSKGLPTKPTTTTTTQGDDNITDAKTTRKNKTTTMMLRRLTRRRVGANDTVVNTALCKIKLESDYIPPVKPEPQDVDSFMNSSILSDIADQPYLADQLANIINENLDNDTVANLDKEENMDLDVFNTLDSDEQGNEVLAKDDMDITIEEEVSSELSYESILNASHANKSTPNGNEDLVRPAATPDVEETAEGDAGGARTPTPTCIESHPPPSTSSIDTGSSSTTNAEVDPVTCTINEVASYMPVSTEQEEELPVVPQNRDSISELPTAASNSEAPSCSSTYIPNVSSIEPVSLPEESKKENEIPSVPPLDSLSSSDIKSSSEDSNHSTDIKIKRELGELKVEVSDLDELRKDVFKCDKCSFSGKKIVSHYVNKHSPCNIPQARLMPETFNGLIELNTSQSPQLLEIVLDESHAPVWPCLYCDDRYDCIADFYDHLTSHTGEFRYECNECGTSYPYQKSLVNHVKLHKGTSKNCIRFTFESVVEKGSRELSGFLCNDCYYFQLRFESIIRHIEQTGHSSFDVRSVRLIRPAGVSTDTKPPAIMGVVDKNNKVPGQKGEEGSENVTSSLEVPQVEFGEEEEEQGVFFSTTEDFSQPTISLNECIMPIPRLSENPILASMMKRLANDGDGKNEDDGEEATTTTMGSRLRSEAPTKVLRSPPKIPSSPGRVDVRNIYKARAATKAWESTKTDDLMTDEANDYFDSCDEESSDGGWSDESNSDVEMSSDKESTTPALTLKAESDKAKKGTEGRKLEVVGLTDSEDGLRNNEHLLKVKTPSDDDIEEKYMTSRDFVPVRRAGDLYTPNTVLFGYVMPTTAKTCQKLRDSKEVDKLGSLGGKRVFSVKQPQFLNDMITNQKLMHLFKCMATQCSYSTEAPIDFLAHLHGKHFMYAHREPLPANKGCARVFNWNAVRCFKDAGCCSYCSARYKDARDLVDHVINQHAQSVYQCSKCFYRSFYQRYVVKHFELEHPNEIVHVLKCHKKVEILSKEATLFQIFVYKCDLVNSACDKTRRYVYREEFLEHLKTCDPTQTKYPCHLCKTSYPFDDIIEHYKVHNLFRFHCSYCQFGSEVKTDLDDHFVLVHPNTSGRVFYRVKATGKEDTGKASESKTAESKAANEEPKPSTATDKSEPMDVDESKENSQDSNVNAEYTSNVENQSPESNGMDVGENEDGEKGRVSNLKGRDLYRCVTGDCNFIADDGEGFKEHVGSCTFVAESRSLSCAHCERKMKSGTNLLEHMKVHGTKKLVCALCSFRCWTSTEQTKHLKMLHRVTTFKSIKRQVPGETDPDVVTFPKDVAIKITSEEAFETSYYLFTRKAVYSHHNVDKLPQCKVFSSDIHCALCPYSTKVRSNIVRHITYHSRAQENGAIMVPQTPKINPVPYLSREGLEFDKMMNLAASSHRTDGAPAKEDEVRKLPQFVKEQFRYVCSVCDHITSDDALLQTHVKVIHSEVSSYRCPHCQKMDGTKNNPDYTVSLDKIPHHLKLHGAKLYKCGHCTVVHHQLRLMEKHIPDKHPEKKPIHYLIRDVDPDGIPSARPITSSMSRRQSTDDPRYISSEKWKCYMCSSKTFFGTWEEARSHCEAIHKVKSQFVCLVCEFPTDDVPEMLSHCREQCKSEEENRIVIMFSKCETFDAEDSSVTLPVWKKHGGVVRHIHGNFTEDSAALVRQYSSQQSSEPQPSTSTTPVKGTISPFTSKSPMKVTSSSTGKARRSIVAPVKPNSTKTLLLNVPIPPTPKVEMFKYHCHKCDMYKTKNPNELRIHLFNEFRYKRWKCLVCSTTFTTEKSLKGHIERDHQKVYGAELYQLQPANPEIEAEIDECIEKQNRKKDLINSFAFEKLGKLSCTQCKEDGFTYETFETHILQKHSG